MTAEQREARLARLEKRMSRVEANMFVFQATVAGKLTEALGLLRRRQEAREAKVSAALLKLTKELSEIRDRLGSVTGPRLTH